MNHPDGKAIDATPVYDDCARRGACMDDALYEMELRAREAESKLDFLTRALSEQADLPSCVFVEAVKLARDTYATE